MLPKLKPRKGRRSSRRHLVVKEQLPVQKMWKVAIHGGTETDSWKEVVVTDNQERALMAYSKLRNEIESGGARVEYGDAIFGSFWMPKSVLSA